jgi:uroporphyrinogen decarboxylase
MVLSITKRERMLGALKRKREGYVPWDINPCPSLLEAWKKHMGTQQQPFEYYDSDFRGVGIGPSGIKTDWRVLNPDAPLDTVFTDDGVWYVPATSDEGHHFVHMLPSALRNAISVKDVENYTWPDVEAEYRWADVPKKIQYLHDKGYAVTAGVGGFFEGMSWMRGPELTLMELIGDEPIIAAVVNKFVERVHFMVTRMTRAGADILMFGDDIGSQDRMFLSPDLWRRWFKKPFGEAIRLAKAINPDILIFFHSDGYIEPVIPDLIDIGLDILNPVQPECMDPENIKAQYGKYLSFWGTIGVQSTMPFGTPREIRDLVKRRIEIVAKGGGLFLAPAHMLEPEVPLENVLAFVDAMKEFGGHL